MKPTALDGYFAVHRKSITFGVVGVLILVVGLPARGQTVTATRRELSAPVLMLDAGARTGMCDVLTFTPAGDELLAAGDDKVVRVFGVAHGRFNPESTRTLRWPIYRDALGAIYACQLSRNDGGRRVAVGGVGLRNDAVAILDRQSGRILSTLRTAGTGG